MNGAIAAMEARKKNSSMGLLLLLGVGGVALFLGTRGGGGDGGGGGGGDGGDGGGGGGGGSGTAVPGGQIQDISLSQDACLHQNGLGVCKTPGQTCVLTVSFLPNTRSSSGALVSWTYRFKVRVVRDPELPFTDEFIYASASFTATGPAQVSRQLTFPTPNRQASIFGNTWQCDVLLEAVNPHSTTTWVGLDAEFLGNAFKVEDSCSGSTVVVAGGSLSNLALSQQQLPFDPTAY